MTQRLMTFPLALAEGYRQTRAVRATHASSGLPILKKSDLAGDPSVHPETLFILGSGESVLATSRTQWSKISQVTSVGIGAWTIHPFVPNFLALEHIERVPDRDGIEDGETGLERSYREALEGWHLREEVQRLQPRILFFRPPIVSDVSRLIPLGNYWQSRTFLYGRVGPSSTNIGELSREIALYLGLARAGVIPFHLPFDTGTTLVRLVLLAALAGYRRIVLNGVDLRHSRFFWEAEPSLLQNRGMSHFFSPEDGEAHSTETTGRFPASEVLPIIARALMRAFGTRLLVAHRESWLSTVLPVFDWKVVKPEGRA